MMRLRQLPGVLLRDLPRYLPRLVGEGGRYLALCNRSEQLEMAPDGSGYRCDWKWTSDLHAPKVLPFLGRWLMRRGLADHPIRRLPQPEVISEQPEASFIVGHRGMARLPHLLATLESIAGQQGATVECIVVEQESESQLAGRLPSWVQLIHTPMPAPNMPYCRSWAFNVGAGQARGSVLVLHDNDMLVTSDYAAQILARTSRGFEVVNVKRFVFYLDEKHTQAVFDGRRTILDLAPEAIVQNCEGGGSVAIVPEAFERIGGMDESFVGWGGEDNEFWERAQTLSVWSWGSLPMVHLWHSSQSGKVGIGPSGTQQYFERSRMPVDARIAELRARPRGLIQGPVVGWLDES